MSKSNETFKALIEAIWPGIGSAPDTRAVVAAIQAHEDAIRAEERAK